MDNLPMTRTSNVTLSLLFISMFSFPNSFSYIKYCILAAALLSIFYSFFKGEIKVKAPDTALFYLIFSLLSSLWILCGLLHGSSYQALYDAFKLYIVFSVLYFLIVTALQSRKYIDLVFKSFFISAFIISIINLTTFAELMFSFNVFPDWFREEMTIGATIHDGYSDVSANNINSLFYIVPILYIMTTSKDISIKYSQHIIMGIFFLSVLASLLSGRRALIILIFLIPLIYAIQKKIVFPVRKRTGNRTIVVLLLFAFPFIIVGYFAYANIIDVNDLINRYNSAFSGDSVRVSQYNSLMEAFFENPLLGSGFGGSADVIRNVEKPWLYELTYIQLLYNGGIIGFVSIFTLFGVYYVKAIKAIRNFDGYQTEALALLTGFVVFCVASLSNPYFSSFDTVFILSTLPLLSGWHAYFEN